MKRGPPPLDLTEDERKVRRRQQQQESKRRRKELATSGRSNDNIPSSRGSGRAASTRVSREQRKQPYVQILDFTQDTTSISEVLRQDLPVDSQDIMYRYAIDHDLNQLPPQFRDRQPSPDPISELEDSSASEDDLASLPSLRELVYKRPTTGDTFGEAEDEEIRPAITNLRINDGFFEVPSVDVNTTLNGQDWRTEFDKVSYIDGTMSDESQNQPAQSERDISTSPMLNNDIWVNEPGPGPQKHNYSTNIYHDDVLTDISGVDWRSNHEASGHCGSMLRLESSIEYGRGDNSEHSRSLNYTDINHENSVDQDTASTPSIHIDPRGSGGSRMKIIARLIKDHLICPSELVSTIDRPGEHFRGPPIEDINDGKEMQHIIHGDSRWHDYPRNTIKRSIKEFLEHSNTQIPWVLDTQELESESFPMTTRDQRKRFFRGYGDGEGPRERPGLDISKHQVDMESCIYRISYDIDSYIATTTSLGAARYGIKTILVQTPQPPLKSHLHLGKFTVKYLDGGNMEDNADEPEKRYLHEIPHFRLGRFAQGTDDLEIIIFFPNACRINQKTAKLPESLFKKWIDRVYLKAIHNIVSSNITRTFPTTYEEAKSKALLRSKQSLGVKNIAREQLLSYFIPGEDLHLVWQECERLIDEIESGVFSDNILMINAKDLKTQTTAPSWAKMCAQVRKVIDQQLGKKYIIEEYLDIGKEWIHPFSRTYSTHDQDQGETALWSLKYISTLFKKFVTASEQAKSHLRYIEYPQFFFHGIGSGTIEPQEHSNLRQAGLLYVQFYNTIKSVNGAGDHYFAANPAIGDLGLAPEKIAVLQNVAQGVSVDPKRLVQAYAHIKDHYNNLHQTIRNKSFGLREEYRVSGNLFDDVDDLMRIAETEQSSTPASTSTTTERNQPCQGSHLKLQTHTMADWMCWNINRLCFGLEFVYHDKGEGDITSWEQARVVSMFFRAISCFLGVCSWGDSVRFWYDEFPRQAESVDNPDQDPERGEQGLGFIRTMYNSGFPWFMDKLDWKHLTFRPEISPYLGFHKLEIEKRLGKKREVRAVRDLSQRAESIRPWLKRFGHQQGCRDLLFRFLAQACAQRFRLDFFNHILDDIKESHRKRVMDGEVPLSYDAVRIILKRNSAGIDLVVHPKAQYRRWDILQRVLFTDKVPKHARNLPYLLMVKRSQQDIKNTLGKNEANEWLRFFIQYIRATHWILPYPGNNRFMTRAGKEKGWRIWASRNRAIVARTVLGSSTALPDDWRAQYKVGWIDSAKAPMLGRPEVDVDLLNESPVVLWERLCDLSGISYDNDDDTENDDDFRPELDERTAFEVEENDDLPNLQSEEGWRRSSRLQSLHIPPILGSPEIYDIDDILDLTESEYDSDGMDDR